MRAAIVNPYLDTLGGGERYTSAFARVLADNGFKVEIQWKSKSIKKKLEERFGIDLEDVEIVKDVKRGDGYDLCFWLSDGSIPLLRSRKNIIHFQFPFKDVNGRSLMNRMKLFRIEEIVCNSYFTKRFIDKEFGVESVVIYPPVDVDKIKAKRKENIILFVGRFSQLEQAKNQHILVEVFEKLIDEGLKDWKLVLAGGVEVGVDDYFSKLQKKAKDLPVEIVKSPSYKKLLELYGKSKIFWSATGFGVDEKKSPKKVEHFGITVVEAMAAGCVPVVYKAGGYKEIVADKKNGFLWSTKKGLIEITSNLIDDSKKWRKASKKGREDAKVYEYERFEAQVKEII